MNPLRVVAGFTCLVLAAILFTIDAIYETLRRKVKSCS